MPQIIQHPKFGNISFPDDMSDDDIRKNIRKIEWENASSIKERVGMVADWVTDPQGVGKALARTVPAGAGQMVPGPVGKFVAAPAGAMLGETLAAAIDERLPTEGELTDAAVNSMARGKAGGVKTAAVNALKYAGANVLGGEAKSLIDEGELMSTGEVLDRANTGGIAAVPGIGAPNRFSKAEQQAMKRQKEYVVTLGSARENGLQVDPALVRPHGEAPAINKAASHVSGQSQLQQNMAKWNQKRMQDIIREENGIPLDAPLNDATFKAARANLLKPYEEVARGSTAGRDALNDWKRASYDERQAFKRYSKDKSNQQAKEDWLGARDAKDAAEGTLHGIAASMHASNPGLMAELLDSKKRLAILHWGEMASDTSGGGVRVDPKVFGDALEAKVGLTGRQEMIGRLYNIMPEVMVERKLEGVDPRYFRFLRFAIAHTITQAGVVPRALLSSNAGQFLTGLPKYGTNFPDMPQQLLRFANLSEQDKRSLSSRKKKQEVEVELAPPPEPVKEEAESTGGENPKRLSFRVGKRYKDPDTGEVRVYLGDGQFALA